MTYTYQPRGVCSRKMTVELEDGIIRDVRVEGGCNGNLQGISRLVIGMPAREAIDVRWAQTCLALEDRVETLEALFEPVFLRRMQQKLWQALYYQYEITQPFLPQLEKNLVWLEAELEKLSAMQRRRNARFDESIEKIER